MSYFARKFAILIFAALVAVPMRSMSQGSSAAREFFGGLRNCAASLGGWKCLELDLTSELVEEKDSTKLYEYSWDFGDRQRVQGTTIEHCYEDFGTYQVTMDLLDMESNTVIRNELSATVHLYPEIYPSINIHIENQAPSFIGFSSAYNEADQFVPDRVYWKIDGVFYEGNSIVHPFPVAGVYLVEMAVEKDMGFLGTVTACATREVTIKDSDVWTKAMRDAIDLFRSQSQTGPFATDEVFCRITDRSSPENTSTVVGLDALMTRVQLEEGKVYDLLLFSGNLLTDQRQFRTHGLSGNNLYIALKDTVMSFFDRPLRELKALKSGEGSALIADTLELMKTVSTLRQHPYLKVAIGSYLHTGSRISKGLAASLSQSAAVKKTLVRMGIPEDRIAIASPEYNPALINTCSALPDCGSEDKELNGKIEFKITGCL